MASGCRRQLDKTYCSQRQWRLGANDNLAGFTVVNDDVFLMYRSQLQDFNKYFIKVLISLIIVTIDENRVQDIEIFSYSVCKFIGILHLL